MFCPVCTLSDSPQLPLCMGSLCSLGCLMLSSYVGLGWVEQYQCQVPGNSFLHLGVIQSLVFCCGTALHFLVSLNSVLIAGWVLVCHPCCIGDCRPLLVQDEHLSVHLNPDVQWATIPTIPPPPLPPPHLPSDNCKHTNTTAPQPKSNTPLNARHCRDTGNPLKGGCKA